MSVTTEQIRKFFNDESDDLTAENIATVRALAVENNNNSLAMLERVRSELLSYVYNSKDVNKMCIT